MLTMAEVQFSRGFYGNTLREWVTIDGVEYTYESKPMDGEGLLYCYHYDSNDKVDTEITLRPVYDAGNDEDNFQQIGWKIVE